MEIVAIGHESYLIALNGVNILIDPILGRGFGSDPQRQFVFTPEREVLLEQMPAIKAIFFTSDHIQHFCPR
ncbi:hypothetical protein [Bartonella sp. DGB2]|uniref:hypothetical protein n=1 Tax=Bartonella sp. DGB2 TaxID=3388426 RepID=UPI00399007F9